MFPIDLYFAFVQLRKQLYKCKTMNWYWKYTKIELERAKYKTFRKFYDECFEWLQYMPYWWDYSTQEIFDKMLDISQSKKGLKRNCY